jgi:hypothetical protein
LNFRDFLPRFVQPTYTIPFFWTLLFLRIFPIGKAAARTFNNPHAALPFLMLGFVSLAIKAEESRRNPPSGLQS